MSKSIYVRFKEKDIHGNGVMPAELKVWLKENKIKYNFGILNGRETGIFLDVEDAILYRLKFGI